MDDPRRKLPETDSRAVEYREKRVAHWDRLADSFTHSGMRSCYHARLAELFRDIIPPGERILEVGCATGDLLACLSPAKGVGIDFSPRMVEKARLKYPDLEFRVGDALSLEDVAGTFDYIIFSDLLDDLWDVQAFFEQLRPLCNPATRIVFNIYSHLWFVPLRLARATGLATPLLPQNWLSGEDVHGLLQLSGFELVNHRTEILLPLPIPLLATVCNCFLAKLFPFSRCNLTHLFVARLAHPLRGGVPRVSVIVPARNEAGNIARLLDQLPEMGGGTEVVFVEGGSSDATYETIVEEIAQRPDLACSVYRQHGNGKGDAVRMGFEHAGGDILMILDADLTVAPQDLTKFYRALVDGHGEFINGVRLVYPMQGKAMRFFNLLGNKFFSLAFSWLLGQPVKDTLCGTKALWKRDYLKIDRNRDYFGDFDPFGDFDLLFGAARLNLKIVDLPVRYGERTYGTTNIDRWSHGVMLLRMVLFAARQLKFR